jgi:hypothetical protein
MYKLLIALGVLDLAFSHPLLTSITLVGVFFYQQLTPDEISQIKSTAMSIYTNGKEFSKYLVNKAQEFKVSIKNLRKQVVKDLEIPEADPEQLEDYYNKDSDHIRSSLLDDLNEEEIKLYDESPALREKIYRTVKEAVAVPNTVWIKGSLSSAYSNEADESFKDVYRHWGIELDWDKTFTEKDFRKLKARLKAIGRNTKGEVVNESSKIAALMELNHVYAYFTNQVFDCINFIIE